MFLEWIKGIWRKICNWCTIHILRRRPEENNLNRTTNINEPLLNMRQVNNGTWNKFKSWCIGLKNMFSNLIHGNNTEDLNELHEETDNINLQTFDEENDNTIIELEKSDRIEPPKNSDEELEKLLLELPEDMQPYFRFELEMTNRRYEFELEMIERERKRNEEEHEYRLEMIERERKREQERDDIIIQGLNEVNNSVIALKKSIDNNFDKLIISFRNFFTNLMQICEENIALKYMFYQYYMANRQNNFHININPTPQFDQRQRLTIMKAITYEPKPEMEQNENHLSEEI